MLRREGTDRTSVSRSAYLARILSTRSGSSTGLPLILSGTSTHPFSTLLFCFSPTTTHSSFSFHSCFFVSVAIADKSRGPGTRPFAACRVARGARGRERSGSGSSRSSGTRRGCKCAGQGMERRAVCERRSRVATLIRMSSGTAVGFGASGFPASSRPITRATVTNPDRRSVFLRRAPNRKTETKLDRRNERAKKIPRVSDRDEIMRAGRRVRIYPDYCRRRG